MLSGRTSLIVRVGNRGFSGGGGLAVNGLNAAPSPEGPPIGRSKPLRFSEPSELKSSFGMPGRLGPEICHCTV